jgi:hypothetical protein
MTDNWDFYAPRVDGEPASIFVDLGIQTEAPVGSLPHMGYVRLFMNQPRPDGLSSSEEFDALVTIEKAMEADLCGASVGYVGRNTSGGCRDFYFYLSTPATWQSQVAQSLSVFKDYKYETGTREDAEWSTYLNFLLPGPLDRQRIENRRVCDALERHGDKLVTQREIDHWSYFPSLAAADAYLAEVEAGGFQVRNRSVGNGTALCFCVQTWRADVPSYDNIDNVTLPLFEAAARHGGEYDGWESPVEA